MRNNQPALEAPSPVKQTNDTQDVALLSLNHFGVWCGTAKGIIVIFAKISIWNNPIWNKPNQPYQCNQKWAGQKCSSSDSGQDLSVLSIP